MKEKDINSLNHTTWRCQYHMDQRILCWERIEDFRDFLHQQEKSPATVEKYLRDVRAFLRFSGERPVTKELVMAYKHCCMERYAVRSVNSMLAAVNALLQFLGWGECRVKSLRLQRESYCSEERELTKGEYLRLLEAARQDEQLYLVLQTICGTGIRVSELTYFTWERVRAGTITVRCKNKIRTILLPRKLRSLLLKYGEKQGIHAGQIFRNSHGSALSCCQIWRKMKALCSRARVKAGKVFHHNLRKLFARTFYKAQRDIAKLADVLGHSSIDTTRIYIMTTGREHRRQMDRLGLVV